MSVVFFEGRQLPSQILRMGHYRGFGENMNTETAIANIFQSLTQGAVDFFGGSSSAAKQAQAQAAAAQAQLYQEQMFEEGQTKRTLIYVGAGLVGVVLLAAIVKSGSKVKIKNKVGGYRRRKRSRR